MYHDILNMLELNGIAGIAVNNNEIIYVNSAALLFFPELKVNSPAADFFPLYNEASTADSPTAFSFVANDTVFDAVVSRCGDCNIITAKPNYASDTSLADNFISSVGTAIKETLSTCGMAASFLRGYVDKSGDRTFEKYYSIAAHGYFSLLRIAANIAEFENRKILTGDSESVDVILLLDELVDSVNKLPSENFAHIEFRSELEYFYVNGSRDELERMFLNILSNSLKFTPKTGKITVSVSENQGRIKIVISDTGCGISRQVMSSVFSRYTIQRPLSASKSGIGIGLPAARNIAMRHGGSILLTSDEGKGTRVYISLPGSHDLTAFHTAVSEYRTSGSRNILSGLADVLDYESYTVAYTE